MISQNKNSHLKTRFPAEWEPHRACWLAWPSHAELWGDILPSVQKEFVELCRCISGVDADAGLDQPLEHLEILTANEEAKAEAARALVGLPVTLHDIPFGDIWVRDTGPIWTRHEDGERLGNIFRFNGWGEKYDLPYDKEVATRVAEVVSAPLKHWDWVLEGGAIETDGQGTILTTEQCLLNENRNRGKSREEIEAFLLDAFGARQVLWIREGLLNDHTDGHIDTLVRFVSPGKVICMVPSATDDPNYRVLHSIREELRGMNNADGNTLEVLEIPSPGEVLSVDGNIMAASYSNFYISNRTIAVPQYGVSHDREALEKLSTCFPGRTVVGVSAYYILHGGGAFHCITQQEPEL